MISKSQLDEKIAIVAESCDVANEAVQFILAEFQVSSKLEHNIEGARFCWLLHDRALLEYGPRAKDLLSSWGLCSTADFGRVVYCLIDENLMHASESDLITDFEDVFAFDENFDRPKFKTTLQGSTQFTILGLVVLTVVAAIVVAGAQKNGLVGVYSNLLYGWMFIVGICCIFFGTKEEKGVRIFLWCVGLLFALFGGLILFGGVV
jgi:uncharacterized repeat protein (TIGR04138 family)